MDPHTPGPKWASIAPISGTTHEAELPVGERPLEFYSLATPKGENQLTLYSDHLCKQSRC